MKNLRFCAAALLLSAVIVISGYSILRSGSGTAFMIENKISASENADKIQSSSLTPYDKQPVTIPDKATELTPEILGSITIDGIPLSIPMKLGELPDEFSYRIITYSEGKDMEGKLTGKYTGIFKLIYNRQSVCNIIVTDTKAAPDKNTIINCFNFSDSTNKYLPQITVAGFDASDTNIRDFNRIYGYDSDEYGYSTFMIEDENNAYNLLIEGNEGYIQSVNIYDKDKKTAFEPELYFYGVDDSKFSDDYIITLPEDYSPETNNSENPDATEINITDEISITLPCTVNELLYALGEDTELIVDTYYGVSADWDEEKNIFTSSGEIQFDKYHEIEVTFNIIPESPLGQAQVVDIT